MNSFRVFLIVGWAIVVVISVRAIQQLGVDGGNIFFTDFSHPWRAQFLSDFSMHLLLMAIWAFYRETKWWVGIICAIMSVMGGGAFSLIYIVVATFRAGGDTRKLLLGKHA